jgi:hypothetical protein
LRGRARAWEDIESGAFVVEYKYDVMHTSQTARAKAEADYITNEGGCFILECYFKGEKVHLDVNSYGR